MEESGKTERMKNMGKSMPPVEVRKMMYEKAVNRYVVAKGDTMKNMKLNRAAVGQVVTYCAIIAAQNLFNLDRDGVERWQAELIRRVRCTRWKPTCTAHRKHGKICASARPPR